MDKVRKLRRYERKDYSQLVDFPVEIAGRDGVVRRYSFEESVRLYQRRIASAAARYDDGELVDAEVDHCRSRIGQLRRSYFARYGWAASQVGDRPGLLAGEFAGEVAAFLRRALGESASASGADAPSFALVDDAEYYQLYYVRAGGPGQEPWLLYLFRFADVGTCPGRDAFFRSLKLLQVASTQRAGVEQLVGFHHTADCGLILTGRDPADAGELSSLDGPERVEWLGFDVLDGDPVQRAFSALRAGRLAESLASFCEAYEAQPFRRAAYVGAGIVADQLGAHAAAETAALMGVRYHPSDALLHHHLAVVHARAGRLAAARTAVASVRRLAPDSCAPDVLEAIVAVQEHLGLAGGWHLWRLSGPLRHIDADLHQAARRVCGAVVIGPLGLASGAVLGVVGALVVRSLVPVPGPLQAGLWLAVAVAAVLVAVAAVLGSRARVRRLVAAPGGWGLRLANPADLHGVAEGLTPDA